jgi:AcrR family transcriptional regulator
VTAPGGLRERKKAAVSQALYEAAHRLAIERGLENVTVEEIAAAASVSRRTFSNYFSGKEEALLHHDRVRVGKLLDLVRDRPAAEPARLALAHAADELVAATEHYDPLWMAEHRRLRGNVALLGHRAAIYAAAERDLARDLARRLPESGSTSLHAHVLAATFLATLRSATEHWREAPERPLREVVAEALALAQR